jgi:hypothetical protein
MSLLRVTEFVEENAPTTAAAGGAAAAGGIAMMPSLPMTASSGTPPGMYYSRVHISSDKAFFKILKKPSIVQKLKLPHMNLLGVFH